jgi:predicted kinase
MESKEKLLILMVGPPGSGKSTLAKQLPVDVIINQDSQGKEEHLELFKQSIELGLSIAVDRMNFSKEQRNRYLEPAKAAGYKTKIQVLHVPKNVCLIRCALRKDHLTIRDEKTAARAVGFFFKSYERVEDTEADEVIRIYGDGSVRRNVVLCDLDGTLCNIDHRLPLMKLPKKDWKGFFAGIEKDSVNDFCANILARFSHDYGIILSSGRPDTTREVTEEWLQKHNIDYNHLFMRPRDDFRPDNVVKEIILEFEILSRYNVYMALDDRDQVVQMLRKHGIRTLQVADGDF